MMNNLVRKEGQLGEIHKEEGAERRSQKTRPLMMAFTVCQYFGGKCIFEKLQHKFGNKFFVET